MKILQWEDTQTTINRSLQIGNILKAVSEQGQRRDIGRYGTWAYDECANRFSFWIIDASMVSIGCINYGQRRKNVGNNIN